MRFILCLSVFASILLSTHVASHPAHDVAKEGETNSEEERLRPFHHGPGIFRHRYHHYHHHHRPHRPVYEPIYIPAPTIVPAPTIITGPTILPAPVVVPGNDQACGPPEAAVPLLRGYNPLTTDHFYTTNSGEMAQSGFTMQGSAGRVFMSQLGATSPLYRLYSSAGTDHLYTTSTAERDSATGLGYTSQGVAGFVYLTQICGSVPLYRLYNPGLVDHLYTTSAVERDIVSTQQGYTYEGITGYVLP